ncbi:MAG: TonB-dependent hemoglobin/transferrin/lactoferrin family receptor, partial [Gammaproteobacteria bacterium]|nr:TonB-dependent hemoglobin/transferrin/lactoferrin family receptor [Gammaproteobacteria bacterium]
MKCSVLVFAMMSVVAVRAEPVAETAMVQDDIPNIVVVATRSPRPVLDVAASVSVIDASQIAGQLAISIADLVRYEPAISVSRGGTRFGDGSYTIRGIGGNRVAIEIDGVPIADQFDIGSYSNAERDLVDVGLIDRIEILRGPASTLYGSDAIGGVVAYTTVDPEQFEDDTVRLHTGYRTDDDSLSGTVTGAWTGGPLGVLLSVSQRSGGQLDSAALTDAEDTRDYRSNALFAKLNWDIDSNRRLTFVADHFERDVDSDIQSVLGTGRFRSTTLLTGDDSQKRKRYSLALDTEPGHALADDLQLLAYHQRSDTRQFTLEERVTSNLRRARTFNYAQLVNGIELGLHAQREWSGLEHRLGYGLDIQRSKTTESRDGLQTDLNGGGATHSMLGEEFPVRDFPVSNITEAGLYVHDEIKRAGSRWTIIPALRFDHYDLAPSPDEIYRADNPDQTVVGLRDSRWSPKLGVLFALTENSSLFAQYAQGFRAPPFEDANIGLDIPLFNIRAIPNPELRSEVSKSFELGWRKTTEFSKISAAVHYTEYQDFIETKVRLGPDPVSGVILFQSQNISSAHIYGMELQLQQQLGALSPRLQDFDAKLALAWSDGKNDQTGAGLDSVDPAEVTASLRWQPERWPLQISLMGRFVEGKRDVDDADQFEPAGNAIFDILSSYQFNKLMLRAGIFNLTDKTYWHWGDIRGLSANDPLLPQLSRPGRNIGLSVS